MFELPPPRIAMAMACLLPLHHLDLGPPVETCPNCRGNGTMKTWEVESRLSGIPTGWDMGVSWKIVVPPNTPKWSFLVGKPKVVGETHHFRKPPNIEFPTNHLTSHAHQIVYLAIYRVNRQTWLYANNQTGNNFAGDTFPTITHLKLNITPEKIYTFPKGKQSSNHHFPGAMLVFREVFQQIPSGKLT